MLIYRQQMQGKLVMLYLYFSRRRGGLMVSALDSGASAPGSSPGRGHCVVFLAWTRHFTLTVLSPTRCINGYRRIVGET